MSTFFRRPQTFRGRRVPGFSPGRDFANSASNKLECLTAPIIDATEFTISIFANQRSAATDYLLSITSAVSDWDYQTLYISSGSLRGQSRDTDNVIDTTASGQTITVGEWFHGAFVVKNSNASRQSFLNGVAGAEQTDAQGACDVGYIRFGVHPNGSSGPFDGQLAWPAIWSVGLNALEVKSLSDGAHPLDVRSDSLLHCWDMATGRDLVGNAHLTQIGTVGYDGTFPYRHVGLGHNSRFFPGAAPPAGTASKPPSGLGLLGVGV